MNSINLDKVFPENMNLRSSIATSNKNNIKINNQKGQIPEHLIFFKEDVLKDIKQVESKLSLKYDIQFNVNTNKINKLETKLDQMNQRIEYLSTTITNDNSTKERLDKLSNLFSKLEENILLQEVRIKNTNIKITETIDKFDKILSETVIYPGVIGPKTKYKTFHDLIDYLLFNLHQLIMFKDKINIDFKEFKYKTDSMMSNFQIKLDYLTKNANSFTTSSIKVSEKKMEQIIKIHMDELKNQHLYSPKAHENKTINLIENENEKEKENQNIIEENSKKIENLEKMLESFKEENEKIKKEINKLTLANINSNLNNSIIRNKSPKKSLRGERNNSYHNEIKNTTSIVKDYIKGKIRENEMFSKRRSVTFSTTPNLESIKENENIYLNQNKKNKIGNIKYSSIKSNVENIGEEEENNDDNEDNSSSSSSVSIKEENNNRVKNYEFQKYLYRVSGNENDLIERKIKKSSTLTSKLYDNSTNSALNYIQMNSKYFQNKKNSINNSISNKSEVENQEKKSIKDSKLNNNNNNFYITTNISNIKKNIQNPEMNKSKENNNNNNNFSTIFEKSKKYDKIEDVKTIITIIKKESRESLIPIIPSNRLINQSSGNINKINNSANNIKPKNEDNQNNTNDINNSSNKNTINTISRNKNITLDSYTKNYYKTKGDYSRIKLANTPTPSRLLNHNNYIGYSGLKLPICENKKLNKAISAGRFTSKNKFNDINKININFKLNEENTQEKEEQNMKKIFNQMKNYIPNDEKALIKERFIKYGYDKEKIFMNNNNKKRINEEGNYNFNGGQRKTKIAQKCVIFEN